MGRHKVNMGDLKKTESEFESGNRNYLKLKEGKNTIRILPPWSEEGRFYQKVGFHRLPNRFSEKVICTNFTFGRDDCPICKRGREIHSKYGKDAAKIFWPQKRAYMNALDLKAGDGIVYIMECGSTIINPIIAYMTEMEDDSMLDLKEGNNVLLKRYQESGFTKYDVMVMGKPMNLADKDYDVDEILEGLHDLSALVKDPDEEEVMDILDILNSKTAKALDDDEDEDEEEERPAKGRKTLDDDDEEEERPKKGKRAVDDDDDEPASPAKKKPAAKAAAKKKKSIVDDDEAVDVDDLDGDLDIPFG